MRRSRLARYRRRRAFAEKQARQRQRLNFVKWFEALQLFTRVPKPLQTSSNHLRMWFSQIGLETALVHLHEIGLT